MTNLSDAEAKCPLVEFDFLRTAPHLSPEGLSLESNLKLQQQFCRFQSVTVADSQLMAEEQFAEYSQSAMKS